MIATKLLPIAPAWRHARSISNISLVDLSMSQITGAKSQNDLVAKLVKTQALQTPIIIQAFALADRLHFLDPAFTQHENVDGAHVFRYAEPYENVPQKLRGGAGSTMSTPHHHAIVAEQFREQLIASENETINVLDVGSGSGYLSALFAGIIQPGGGHVIGMECVPELVDLGRSNCADKNNVTIVDAFVGAQANYNEWNLAPVEALPHVNIIHVGFTTTEPVVDMFLQYLAPGGTLVVPLRCDPDDAQAQHLVRYDRNAAGVESTVVMPVLCQQMQSTMLDPVAEQETPKERLVRVQAELTKWREDFTTRHGREPTRQDMFVDQTAATLFESFTELRKRAW